MEQRGLSKRKFNLGGIEHVEYDHVVPLVLEVFQAGENLGRLVEQIAEDGHHAATCKSLGRFVQDRAYLRCLVRGPANEQTTNIFQVRGLTGGPEELPNLRIERGQPDAIGLLHDKVAKRGCCPAG